MEHNQLTPLEQQNALEALLKSTGWGLLANLAVEQAKFRERRVLLAPLESVDKLATQEFEKGEAAGLRLMLRLPHSLLDSLRAEIEKEEPQENDD